MSAPPPPPPPHSSLAYFCCDIACCCSCRSSDSLHNFNVDAVGELVGDSTRNCFTTTALRGASCFRRKRNSLLSIVAGAEQDSWKSSTEAAREAHKGELPNTKCNSSPSLHGPMLAILFECECGKFSSKAPPLLRQLHDRGRSLVASGDIFGKYSSFAEFGSSMLAIGRKRLRR